jgi:hypothetical protein
MCASPAVRTLPGCTAFTVMPSVTVSSAALASADQRRLGRRIVGETGRDDEAP